jgi:hypothetical protein
MDDAFYKKFVIIDNRKSNKEEILRLYLANINRQVE